MNDALYLFIVLSHHLEDSRCPCTRSRFIAHALIAMLKTTSDIMKAVKPIPTVKVNMASSS